MNLKPLLLFAAISTGVASLSAQLVSDLPTVRVTVPNINLINTDTYILSQITIEYPDGTKNRYDDTRLRGRGTAKFALDKKPYKLKFASKVRLLSDENSANAKKWNLMAQAGDKTLLRNAVGSFIALETGQPFAPGVEFVDLVLNDEYRGTYQITDQVDIRKHRVDITEQPEVIDASTNITGGYLLEVDDGADELEGTVFTTTRGVKITVKSPDEDVIQASQVNYIKDHVQKFEDSLFADNWLDPTQGYRKYLNLESFIQWYITNEYAASPNAFRSVYFYKDINNDLLYFGPVWDLDFAFDNSARFGSRPRALIAQEGRGPEWCFTWINRLRQDPAFHEAVNSAWTSLVNDGIVAKVNAYIDSQASLIQQSQAKNFEVYPINVKAHDEMFLFGTYAEGVEFLKKTQAERAEFLTEAFATLAAGGSVPVVGDQTSITDIAAPSESAATAVYDLQGRRVLSPSRGIYIVNGKKTLIK